MLPRVRFRQLLKLQPPGTIRRRTTRGITITARIQLLSALRSWVLARAGVPMVPVLTLHLQGLLYAVLLMEIHRLQTMAAAGPGRAMAAMAAVLQGLVPQPRRSTAPADHPMARVLILLLPLICVLPVPQPLFRVPVPGPGPVTASMGVLALHAVRI